MPTPPTIRVPKPQRGSFDPNRLLAKNLLLLNQVKHFRGIELALPPERQTGVDFDSIRTEGQAADYIRKMTAALKGRVPRR